MSKARALAPQMAIGLVLAASLYTAVLCLINTHVTAVSNTLVAVCDGAILLAALILALRGGTRWLWVLLAALAVNFLTLALLSDRFELKSVRDPLVLITFAALGWRHGSFAHARIAFFLVSAIVLAVGLLEWIAPDLYTQAFNVLQFYNARGMVDAQDMQRLDTAFFISGERGGERLLFPMLGTHRASSIFLEPVSMGNFGAIAVMFALSLERAHWRSAIAAASVGAVAIVLADARFASMAALLFLVARMLPASWTRIGLAILPLVAIGALFAFAFSNIGEGDDLPTRLAGSGRTILALEPAAVLGFSPHAVSAWDSGYAYAMGAFGLPLCIALWAAFVAAPAPSQQARRYKLLLGVYVCALLCISGTSLFALKTAALGFFVLGALAAPQAAMRPTPRLAPSPVAARAPA